jgi:hypothetical protein
MFGPAGASAARRITQAVAAVLATLILIGLVVPGSADTSTPTDDRPAAATSPQASTPASPAPTIEKQTVTETREIPFKEKIVKDSSLAKGTREVRTEGVPGVKPSPMR